MAGEAEVEAGGQADEPVAAEVYKEAGVGVARAAEGADDGDLESVAELEEGGDGEERDGGGDHWLVRGEEAGDGVRKGEIQGGDREHEGPGEQEGGPACSAGLGGSASADGLADADASGGGDAERDHEGEGDAVEGDLMASERDGAEEGDGEGHDAEDGDLHHNGGAGGDAEGEQAAEERPLQTERDVEEAVAMAAVVKPNGRGEDEREIDAGERGCKAGAEDSEALPAQVQAGEAPTVAPIVAVDEEPVEEEIDEIGGDEREGDGTDVIEGLQVTAKGEIDEQRKHAEGEGAQHGEGLRADGRRRMHVREAERDEQEETEKQPTEKDGEDEAVDQPAMRFGEFAGAVGLGDDGIEAEQDAAEADGEGVKEDLREGGGGEGGGGVGQAADHGGVDQAHGHPAELAEDEGQGEQEHGAEFAANGLSRPSQDFSSVL